MDITIKKSKENHKSHTFQMERCSGMIYKIPKRKSVIKEVNFNKVGWVNEVLNRLELRDLIINESYKTPKWVKSSNKAK